MKISSVLIIVSLRCVALVHAQHSDWTIYLSNDSKLSDARLLSMTNDTLSVSSLGQTQRLPIASINKIQRRESPPKTGIGILVGSSMGVGVGYIVGSFTQGGSQSTSPYSTNSQKNDSREIFMLIGGVVGGVVGAGVGGTAGIVKYDLHEKTPEEKFAALRSVFIFEGIDPVVGFTQRVIVYFKDGASVKGEMLFR